MGKLLLFLLFILSVISCKKTLKKDVYLPGMQLSIDILKKSNKLILDKNYIVLSFSISDKVFLSQPYIFFFDSTFKLESKVLYPGMIDKIKNDSIYFYKNFEFESRYGKNYYKVPIKYTLIQRNQIQGIKKIQNKIITNYKFIENSDTLSFFIRKSENNIFAALYPDMPITNVHLEAKFRGYDTINFSIRDLNFNYEKMEVWIENEIYENMLECDIFLFQSGLLMEQFYKDYWSLLSDGKLQK